MATITTKDFTSLEPIELKYQYNKNEELRAYYVGYEQGLNVYRLDGLKNFQDVAVSNGTCFVLTTAVGLSSFFTQPTTPVIGQIPGTLKLQSRSLSGEYFTYDSQNNIFTSTSVTSGNATNFFILPVPGTSKVQILVNNKYVQVDQNYPYTVRVGDKLDDDNDPYRQEFYCEVYNNLIALKTYTTSGYRYLALGNDKTLRATGVILNSLLVNDYLFNSIQNTASITHYGFDPDMDWITYYLDFPAQTYNKDVSLNKVFSNLKINFLLDFPVEPAINNGEATFNLANLKTGLTPTGSPPQIDNSYDEQIITTN